MFVREQAKKIEIDSDSTLILDGGGDPAAIQERCDNVQQLIDTTTSKYEADKAKERLAKLSGGVGVIKVMVLDGVFLDGMP